MLCFLVARGSMPGRSRRKWLRAERTDYAERGSSEESPRRSSIATRPHDTASSRTSLLECPLGFRCRRSSCRGASGDGMGRSAIVMTACTKRAWNPRVARRRTVRGSNSPVPRRRGANVHAHCGEGLGEARRGVPGAVRAGHPELIPRAWAEAAEHDDMIGAEVVVLDAGPRRRALTPSRLRRLQVRRGPTAPSLW